jgi:hypothetical protein
MCFTLTTMQRKAIDSFPWREEFHIDESDMWLSRRSGTHFCISVATAVTWTLYYVTLYGYRLSCLNWGYKFFLSLRSLIFAQKYFIHRYAVAPRKYVYFTIKHICFYCFLKALHVSALFTGHLQAIQIQNLKHKYVQARIRLTCELANFTLGFFII